MAGGFQLTDSALDLLLVDSMPGATEAVRAAHGWIPRQSAPLAPVLRQRSGARRCACSPSARVVGCRRCTPARYAAPVVHKPPPPLEQVGAGIGHFDPVQDDVSQRCLDHLARVVRLLRRPVPERRAEAMRHAGDAAEVRAAREAA